MSIVSIMNTFFEPNAISLFHSQLVTKMKQNIFRILLIIIGLSIATMNITNAKDKFPLTGPEFPLWSEGAPFSKGTEPHDIPTLTVYAPKQGKANGASIVVCPGGGYGGHALGHEGDDIGKWLNSFGVTAFILQYRLAPHYGQPVPLLDAQRAIRTVRFQSKERGLDPNRIGILGFSAGGHLTSTAGTKFDAGDPNAKDPVDRVSCKPDWLVLLYPVINMQDDYTHKGSRKNLLGNAPSESLIKKYSNHLQVTEKTPPTFLFHTTDDQAVPVQNSVLFYLALTKNKVPAELHVYEPGRHGVGLAKDDKQLSSWPKLCENWMRYHNFLTPSK